MFRRKGLRGQQKSQHDQKYQPPDPPREEVKMNIYYINSLYIYTFSHLTRVHCLILEIPNRKILEARTLTKLFRKPPSPEIEVLMFLRGNQKDIYIYIHVHLPRMSLTMLTSVSLGSRSWCRGQSRLKGLMTPGAGRCGTPSTLHNRPMSNTGVGGPPRIHTC